MEKKDLNLTYIYLMAIFAIGVAMANIIAFFGGVGFALVGAGVLLVLAARKILSSADKKRFGDIVILITIEILMFIVLFFAYDFNINGITNKFPMVMRNICAIYSIFALGYTAFRYLSEIKGKKYKFVEYILGNYTPIKKNKKVKPSKEMVKKNRELENGTLEPKPITIQSQVNTISPINNQQSNTANSTLNQQSNMVNHTQVDTQSSNIAEPKMENSQLRQPQEYSAQQSAQTSNSEQKTNVMDTIKNHPSYWE